MKYKVAIRNNSTKEIRIRDMGDIPWGDSSEFWWTDGNFGCDCNRELEFLRAGNEEKETSIDEVRCGEDRYSVLYAELEDGTKIIIDEENGKQ